MSNKQNTETYNFDWLKWSAIALITALSIVANYYYASYAVSLRVIGWIVWLLVIMAIASMTAKGAQSIEYLKEANIELRKVVWPTRQETVQTTIMVIVMVSLVGAVLWAIDSGLLWFVGMATNLHG